MSRRRNSEYHGQHRPAGPDYGAPLHDVNEMMPDYYSRPDWYYAGDRSRNDHEAASVVLNARGKPWKTVWVYRAVPKGVKEIRPGDWVTTVRAYAKEHIENALGGEGHIIKRRVHAGDLYTEGNSHFEWGWHPRAGGAYDAGYAAMKRAVREARQRNPQAGSPRHGSRTRKANPAREYGAGPVWVGSAVRPWRLVVFEDGRQTERHVSDARGKTLQFDTAQAAMAWWEKNGQKWVNRQPNPCGARKSNPAASPFAAEVARLRSDPTLQSASMRQHLRNVAKAPGSGRPRRSAAAREWKEFAGYEPNHVEKIDGVALKGNLPGVRVDVLEGVGAETGRRVKIDAGQKPLYLVWFKSGERFAVTGGPSAMRELARDFSRLNEPIYLTKVDYVAPRYPVPEGVRRTKANAELSIAFTHAVENPTLMTWNGKLDPRHARFDIRVKGRRRRWVNRSGLIF